MNICKQLFKTLMVLTTLMYCESGYTTTSQEFSLLDFDIKGMLGQCSVNEQTGLITYQGKPVKYSISKDENKTTFPCYDLQTVLDKAILSYTPDSDSDTDPTIKMDEQVNLVVKNTGGFNNYTYTISAPKTKIGDNKYLNVIIPENVNNIIIPCGVTICQKDVTFNIYSDDVNLIVRGNMDNKIKNYNYSDSLFNFHNNANVLIGATAEIDFNNVNHNTMFQLNTKNSNVVLYPGCKISVSGYKCNNTIYQDLITSQGKLYLSKYSNSKYGNVRSRDYNNIQGTISNNMKIVFPSNGKIRENDDNINYMQYSVFSKLWIEVTPDKKLTNDTVQTADYTKHFTEYDSFLYKKIK